MPGESGLEVIRHLKALDLNTQCLILSMYPEEQYGVRAIKVGASGYLTKNVHPNILKEAMHRICTGQKYFDNLLAEKMTEEIRGG
jgi:DNA-binding NarL/FixJ family response regulator